MIGLDKNNYLSTLKAMGIILMVVGHSGCPEYFHQLIYYFHMPLFFFVSGYFLHPEEGDGIFIKKRINGLYLTYIKWSLAFLLVHNCLFNIGIYNDSYGYNGNVFHAYDFHEYLSRFFYVVFTMDKHEPLLGGFWFLKTLLCASIMVKILIKLISYIAGNKKVLITFFFCVFGLLVVKFFDIFTSVCDVVSIPVIDCYQDITWPFYSLAGISIPLLVKAGYDRAKANLCNRMV